MGSGDTNALRHKVQRRSLASGQLVDIMTAMQSARRKILVVDDDADIVRIVLYTLNNAGYKAVPAYGVDDALRKIEREDFDLVLTDLAMPRLSGVHLIDALRTNRRTSEIPIVAMTAFTWDTLGRTAGEVGCDGYLTKPFRSDQLLDTVKKYLPPEKVP